MFAKSNIIFTTISQTSRSGIKHKRFSNQYAIEVFMNGCAK